MAESKVRMAILGCGAVTKILHLPALTKLKIKPAILVDRDLPRAQSLAEKFGAAAAAADYHEAEGKFDTAIVALPHHLHVPVCVDLLGKGIHVLVEKPMAVNAEGCERMLAAAQTGKAVLAVGLMRRFWAVTRWVKAALDAGILGKVQSFDFREGYVYGWPVASDFFFRRETAGGGVLIDTGAHTLDLLTWWLGGPKTLAYFDDDFGGVEADCRIELTLQSGARGTVELSRTRNLRNTAVIKGEKGELEIGFQGNFIRATPGSLLDFKADGIAGNKLPLQRFTDLFTLQLQDWLQAARSGGPPTVSGVEGARSVSLIERCYTNRRPLRIPWAEPSEALPGKTGEVKGIGTGSPIPRVLVTGATGFIGGRLVERLIEESRAEVRALVHQFGHAPRIARFGAIEMLPGGLTDSDAVDKAVRGCNVVYHLAHDFGHPESNVEGARNLAEACLRHGIKRLVHVSTISVYEPLPDGDVDESSPAEPCGWTYPDNKLEIERELLRYHREKGLPVTVVQPTIVYGPYSGAWTLGPIMELKSGRVALPDGGEGLCNAVYVDDVVQGLLLAAQKDGAVGERFLISAAEPVTWREFYGRYEAMIGRRSLVSMSSREIGSLSGGGLLRATRKVLKDPQWILSWPWLSFLYPVANTPMGQAILKRFRKTFPQRWHIPDAQRLALFHAKARIRIDKARRVLGYEPAFDFERGMKRTEEFVKGSDLDQETPFE